MQFIGSEPLYQFHRQGFYVAEQEWIVAETFIH